MIALLALSLAATAGVSVLRLLLLGSAVFLPVPTLVALAAWWVKGRSGDVNTSALFCEGVASELRAGATLPVAVRAAASAVGLDSPPVDASVEQLSGWMRRSFSDVGPELALTYRRAVRAGNDPALIFDEIASFALVRSEIDSEVRIALAPGVATAALLVGAPLLFAIHQAESGQLAWVMATPGSQVPALLGLGLFLVGCLAALAIVARSR